MKSGKKIKNNDDELNDSDEFVPKAFKKTRFQKNDKHKKVKSKKRRISILMIIMIVTFLIIELIIFTNKWLKLAKNMQNVQDSVVLNSDGKQIAEIGEEKKRIYVSSSEMPEYLKNAYISIEDQRFYKHHGVDIRRTGGAIFSYIIHFGKSSFGGSTITQQLVKNITGDSDKKISRKIGEWYKAFTLDNSLSKDDILEYYLNIIYVGPNLYGVGAGSKYYFDKDVKDLSIAECAFLAGINNSPASYKPFDETEESKEKVNNRTKTVLSKMKELGYISETKYNDAVQEVDAGLKFKKGNVDSGNAVYSYHTDAVINEVLSDIEDKYNISEDFATNFLYLSGSKIYSTEDLNVQESIETECKKKTYILESKVNAGATSQAAMVVMEPNTGYILGCVGGLGEKTESRSLNRATQSTRQTGSSLKPLSVLLPGISDKIFTASTIYDDTVEEFEPGFAPTDYDSELGKITVRRAVESSQNIPFVRMLKEITPKKSKKFLESIGITTLTEGDESLGLSLGALEKGISPLEMAGAYNTMANDGVYIEPTFYTKIVEKDGNVLMKTSQKKKRVVSKQVAYILKSLLEQPVLGVNGTATYCKISGIDVAAKTGTSDENYDRWLCGFTNYYTAVAWFGYDQNETVEFNRKNPAGYIWANVMKDIHKNKNDSKFEIPSGVIACTVCKESGMRARSGCKDTYTEYYLKGTLPAYCNTHSGSEVNDATNEGIIDKIKNLFGFGSSSNSNSQKSTSTNTNINRSENHLQNSTSTNTYTNNSQNTTNINTNTNNSQNTTNTNTTNNNVRNSTNTNNNTQNSTNTNINDSRNNTNTNINTNNNTNNARNTNTGTNENSENASIKTNTSENLTNIDTE